MNERAMIHAALAEDPDGSVMDNETGAVVTLPRKLVADLEEMLRLTTGQLKQVDHLTGPQRATAGELLLRDLGSLYKAEVLRQYAKQLREVLYPPSG